MITGKREEIKRQQRDDQVKRDWMTLLRIIFLSILFYCAYLLSYEVFGQPSRRLSNLTFVLYHSSAVLAGMATGAVQELLLKEKQANLVEEAISYN